MDVPFGSWSPKHQKKLDPDNWAYMLGTKTAAAVRRYAVTEDIMFAAGCLRFVKIRSDSKSCEEYRSGESHGMGTTGMNIPRKDNVELPFKSLILSKPIDHVLTP